MPLPAQLRVLQFERCLQLQTIGKRYRPSIGHIGRIDLADRIVAIANGKLTDNRAIDQLVAELGEFNAFNTRGNKSHTIGNGSHRRTGDNRRQGIGSCCPVIDGNTAQQCAQVRIVPGLNTARRQALCLQRLYGVVAGTGYLAVPGQVAHPVDKSVDQRRFSGCGLASCMNIHHVIPQAASPIISA